MEEIEQNDQPQPKETRLPNWIVPIIVAVIGALGAIIAALIIAYRTQSVEIKLVDIDTKQSISGEVFLDNNENGIPSNPENPAVIRLRRGSSFILAKTDGYEPKIVSAKNMADSRTIEMKKIVAIIAATPAIPLPLTGFREWSSEITLSRGENTHEIIVNGICSDAAGFAHTTLNTNMLRGRTLVLYFSNVEQSVFSRNRMVKLEYNRNDILLNPVNASLLNDGYLPAENTPVDSGIEFPIPDNFEGKLNFSFYQAELRNLKIAAYYR